MTKKKNHTHIQKPVYPGGKAAFIDFLKEHLNYPAEAIENKIEGTVLLEYKIEIDGSVTEIKLIHGIGYGCDEEAIRVLKMVKYLPAHNKGMKVSTRRKIPIKFGLPKKKNPTKETNASIQYQYVNKKNNQDPSKEQKKNTVYQYRIDY